MAEPHNAPPIALTVAGSDTGGAAGIAADLKSFSANGVHGVYALTLLTAQNSTGIHAASTVEPSMIAAQLDALTEDFEIAATKTGLLFSADAVSIVADRIDDLGALVIDPVLVRSNGSPLVDDAVVTATRDRLFPAATVISPNASETTLLTGIEIDSLDDAAKAAEALLETGCGAAVVTGVPDDQQPDMIVDVVARSGEPTLLARHVRVDTPNLLGTGCSFSAAITAGLAKGFPVIDAINAAQGFVADGLRSAHTWRLCSGQGGIDHMARQQPPDYL